MFSLNRAELIGNLTRDPETRSLPSGQTVCAFAIATNRRWKDRDGNQKEDAQYHEITVWGRLGELAAQMLAKGKKVYVEGRLQTNSWEGADGVKRSRTEIVAENFIPLSPREGAPFASEPDEVSKPAEPAAQEAEAPQGKKKKADTKDGSGKAETTENEINLDDIPF